MLGDPRVPTQAGVPLQRRQKDDLDVPCQVHNKG